MLYMKTQSPRKALKNLASRTMNHLVVIQTNCPTGMEFGISAENNIYNLSSGPMHLKHLLHSSQTSYSHPNDASFPLLCSPSFEGSGVREMTPGSPMTKRKTRCLITWYLSFPTVHREEIGPTL